MAAYLAGVWVTTAAVSLAACHASLTWRSVSGHAGGLMDGLVIGLGAGVFLTLVIPPLRVMALSPLRQGPGDWLVDRLRAETVMVGQLGCRRPRRKEVLVATVPVAAAARQMMTPGPALAVSHDPLPAVAAAPRTLIIHESVLQPANDLPHAIDAPSALRPLVQHGLAHISLGHPLIAALLIHELADKPARRRRRRSRPDTGSPDGEQEARLRGFLTELELQAERYVEELGLRTALPAAGWRCLGREALGDDPGDPSGQERISGQASMKTA
jgi:hypothetical protein